MNYQEMSELEIVRRVGDLVGVSWADLGENYNPLCIWVDGDLELFDPITSWADAGPIIQESRISIEADGEVPCSLGSHGGHQWWCASSNSRTFQCNYQSNPLRAAMVVFLMMKGGE